MSALVANARNAPLRTVLYLVGAAVLLISPFMVTPYRVFQLTLAVTYALAIVGLTFVTGRTGQISVAHSALFATGAYTAGLLIGKADWPLVPAVAAAAAMGYLLGLLIGLPALRVQGLYLVLLTLSVAVVAPLLIKRFSGLTGGSNGLRLETSEAPAWTGLATDQWIYFVCLSIAVLGFVVAHRQLSTRIGRAMTAVRDHRIAASTVGIDTAHVRVQSFAWSGFYAGLAGGLYVYAVGFAAPGAMGVFLSIALLTGAVIGGVGSLTGAVIGGFFIQYVPTLASDINDALGGLLYGVALILVMWFFPGGIVELSGRARQLLRKSELRENQTGSVGPAFQKTPERQQTGRRLPSPSPAQGEPGKVTDE